MLSDVKTPIRIDIAKKRDKKLGRKSELRKKLLERGIEKEKKWNANIGSIRHALVRGWQH